MERLKNHFPILSSFLALALVPSTASAAPASSVAAVPEAPTSCHLLTSASPIPEGFGAAYNLFSSEKEPLLKVDCGFTSDATLQVGNGQDTLYIYKTGYEWTGSSWRQLALDGQTLDGDWYVGSAETNLIRSEDELAEDNFVVAYTCYRNGSRWKCGCRDQSCGTNYWQLQAFQHSGVESQEDGTGLATHGDKDFFMVGRKFPSAHQAPIKIPHLIFPLSEQGYGFPSTASANSWRSTPDPSWWTKQPHKIFVANRWVNSADESAGGHGDYSESQYYSYFKQRLDQGYDGLALDEYSWSGGNGAARQKNTFNPLRRLQNEFPKALMFAFLPHFRAGGNNVDQVANNHDAFDMIISESYVNCAGTTDGWDIDLAAFYKKISDSYKNFKLTGKAMMGISIGSDSKCPSPSRKDFDRMLTEIRRQLPYAPHIFLWHKWGRSEDPARWDGYMASIRREIFDKAPAAQFLSPSNDAPVSGTVTVSAKGIRNGGTNTPIAGYRFFVDNELVQVGPHSTYAWDTRRWPAGEHVLTVHAVDEAYLAGADQVIVKLQ